MSTDPAVRRRRYRRFVIAFSVAVGIALGVGLGSFAVLTGWWVILLLLLMPVGVRVIGHRTGRPGMLDPVSWLWPIVAFPVAVATFIVVPHDVAWIGIVLAVAAWFVMIVVGGVLEVVVDPDGTIAGSTD
jgi:hypothetical protein